jgi:hypothetical protein
LVDILYPVRTVHDYHSRSSNGSHRGADGQSRQSEHIAVRAHSNDRQWDVNSELQRDILL